MRHTARLCGVQAENKHPLAPSMALNGYHIKHIKMSLNSPLPSLRKETLHSHVKPSITGLNEKQTTNRRIKLENTTI